MYLWARQWDIQPSEFWDMTINEWHAEYELKTDAQQDGTYAGKLTKSDVDELLEWTNSNGTS